METVGVIGLGLMGSPMARRLMGEGFSVVVWNRTAEKAKPLLEAGAYWGDSPKEVAARSDVVLTMVANSQASEEVACGPAGILEGAHPGLVLIDMGSISADTAKTIAERARAVGVSMLDAPVTGNGSVAAKGELGIMVGGEKEVFLRCLPILQHLGTKIVHAGSNGAGCNLKIINNLVLNVAIEAACEALVLATKVGIDPALVIDITSVGGARTFAMQSRGPRILDRDFAPRSSINTQYKDLTNAIRLAEQAKVPLPVTTVVRELFQAARAKGLGDLDTAAVVTVLEALADVTVTSPQKG
jgi:3-hydroxyisobutyrate dehydrogenase-like beta-hydroxyacid dehydrogenase